MGAVQKLATVVIVGLVGLATLLVVFLANEPHRRDTEAKTQQEVSIERGVDMFVQYCVACHAANGAGNQAGDTSAGHPPHIGATLGGVPYGIDLNQKGVNIDGTPWPGGLSARADYLYHTIYYGKQCNDAGNNCLMPDWGKSGQLNEEQINDLVIMIQHVDWNYVYNKAIEANSGKWPTQQPVSGQSSSSPAAATQAPSTGQANAGGQTFTVEMVDTAFKPKELTIPANTPVKIELKNTGALTHDFSIDKLKIQQTVDSGKTGEVTINAPAGDYQYYCNQPGHKAAGMVGTLHVVAGAAGGGGQASGTPAAGASPAAQKPASTAAASSGGAAGGATSQTVDMQDIKFVPNTLTIPANTDVKITLKNTGALPHDFSIDKLKIAQEVDPGKTGEVTINAPAGTYQFYCNEPGHKAAGMVGTLTVK